jgi:hypothetical protein
MRVVSDLVAEHAAQRAFTGGLPEFMPLGQKMLLCALFACADGEDRPVEAPHAELAALASMELSGYFTCLLKLKFAGFVTGDGQGLRIDHSAIRAAKAANAIPPAKRRASGRSSGSSGSA